MFGFGRYIIVDCKSNDVYVLIDLISDIWGFEVEEYFCKLV